MDIGIIVALIVAITLTLVAGILAGLFGGMWWQARKTAEVWEKAYTHVRELLPSIQHDTYNTGRTPQPPKERVVVQAGTSPPPPVTPSPAAQSFGIELEDDPFGPQVKR